MGVGGPSGLIGPKIKLYSLFQRIFKTRWSKAAAADPGEGVRALAIRGFEPLIFRRPKGRHLLGLAATRAAARFIPFGGAGRGPGTGARFTRKFNFLGNFTLKRRPGGFVEKGHRK